MVQPTFMRVAGGSVSIDPQRVRTVTRCGDGSQSRLNLIRAGEIVINHPLEEVVERLKAAFQSAADQRAGAG